MTAYADRLRAEDSPLGRLPCDELRSVVHPLLDALALPDAAPDTTSEDVGRSRALQQINPVHSLRGASVLYDVVAAVVVRGADELGCRGSDLAQLLRELFEAILRRVSDAAVPYARVLLQQIADAHSAERLRVARDLHDRSAHALALAFQQLDVRQIRLARGEVAGAEASLDVLRTQLQDAAEMIRDLARDLGSDHTRDGLVVALQEYLEAGGDGRASLHVDDPVDVRDVPSWVREQMYLSIREAVRNALLHSGSDDITVRLAVRYSNLVAVVRDRGVGMSGTSESPARRRTASSGTGMCSMVERVEHLGGSAVVESSPEHGTTVELVVPLP
ncbi:MULTISPECIES: sensor histidine kinase [unclassified Isoptericola]|uniref:sensor histidine kinase n=1 Tax=unclassified Isoptericola TaxID=2623355 RepID=UPI00271248FA|nr:MULTISPECIES: ATP-binding protein [unclassified Isoptericola]MDO8145899.1 ATP-binding protein [Isoptericola sp. 178]MDO8147750.1 ATP-binding protein [Isoptericola sp. b515]